MLSAEVAAFTPALSSLRLSTIFDSVNRDVCSGARQIPSGILAVRRQLLQSLSYLLRHSLAFGLLLLSIGQSSGVAWPGSDLGGAHRFDAGCPC